MKNKPKQSSRLDSMLAKSESVTRPNNLTDTRIDSETVTRPAVTTNKRQREAGKRALGYIQIAGLIPPQTRHALTVALAFEDDDLSELLTKLIDDWLASRPAHVQAAIKAAQANPNK